MKYDLIFTKQAEDDLRGTRNTVKKDFRSYC